MAEMIKNIHACIPDKVQRGRRLVEFKTGFDCLRWLRNGAAPQLNRLLTFYKLTESLLLHTSVIYQAQGPTSHIFNKVQGLQK